MLKKIFTGLLLVSLILSLNYEPSSALFFKKNKSPKKQQIKEVTQTLKSVNLAVIYASWCPGCKNIQPVLDQIEKELSEKVSLIYLDVSTPKNALVASKKAKELNLTDFYSANKSKTATVGIIIQKNNEIVSIFQNNNNIDEYKDAIERALTKAKSLDNPPA